VTDVAIRGLTKRYGTVTAVEGLSFDVPAGQVTGFLGPNGAGKTTTLRMLLGLVQPSAGTALIGGQPYHKLTQPRAEVGAVLEATGFHPGRKGRDHLRVLARAAGLPADRVAEVLDRVGLTSAARRRVGRYSLGMRQRLALAAALLGDPEVLILDEPGNGLDPAGMASLRELLRGLAAEGRTVLVSSHVLSEAAQTVDRVVIISSGQLRFSGALTELADASAVTVTSPRAGDLATVLKASGYEAEMAGDTTLQVRGAGAAEIGRLAAQEGFALTSLGEGPSALEQAFLRLTGEDGAPGAAGVSAFDTTKEPAR
jgi:ABC-2 type transport system ATP-binding protein